MCVCGFVVVVIVVVVYSYLRWTLLSIKERLLPLTTYCNEDVRNELMWVATQILHSSNRKGDQV